MTAANILALISVIATAVWLGAILILHGLRPRLDPRTHTLSEYALEPGGWLMQLAFYSMAVSVWTLAAAACGQLSPLGPALLVLCGIGFAGAGVFVADPLLSADRAQTRSGFLHNAFAFFVIAVFPMTATIVGVGLAGGAGAHVRAWLVALSILTWPGLIAFVGGAVAFACRQKASIGYAQRFMVLTYTVWLIGTGLALATGKPTSIYRRSLRPEHGLREPSTLGATACFI